jgi:pimeloyl-[acyl-carrier protein] methyl ester esterase
MQVGRGQDLVLVHGWAASGRVFDGVVTALAEDHRCSVVDLPGHGAAAESWDVGLEELVEAVRAQVARFDRPPRLVGWAMGALIGLEVAARVPVRSLVCVGTASGGPDAAAGFTKMAELMVRDWPRFARSSADMIVGDRVSSELHGFLTRMMTDTPLSVARRTILDVAESDARVPAADVDRPVLYVHGSEDRISPLSVGQQLAETTERSQLVVYDGVGHAPHLEDPDRFLADVRSFWKAHDDA